MRALQSDGAASAAVAFSGLLWGLFWIPMRGLQDAGLNAGVATMLLYGAAAIVMLPAAIRHRDELRGELGPVLLTALFTGGGFALYTLALLLTDVARTILLFYLTPAWGGLLGWLLLGVRPGRMKLAGLACGFLGLMIVFRADERFPWPQNLGDALALAAGIVWAYGSLRLYSAGARQSTSTSVFLFFVGGVAVSATVVLSLLGGTLPSAAPGGFPAGLFLVTLAVFILPGVYLTLWGAGRLTAMRVGILLLGEVVVGVISAAILTDEPFGLREGLGTLLVVAAGLFEVTGKDAGPAIAAETADRAGS